MTLTHEQIEMIMIDMLTGSKVRVTGPDADDFKKQFQADIDMAKENGWNIIIPHDIQDISTDPYKVKKSIRVIKGGPGSGHFGHEGRPGKVGGSMPSGKKRQLPLFEKPPVDPNYMSDEDITRAITEGGSSLHRDSFREASAQAFWDLMQESEVLIERRAYDYGEPPDLTQDEYISEVAKILNLDGDREKINTANLLYDAFEYYDPDTEFKSNISKIRLGYGADEGAANDFFIEGNITDKFDHKIGYWRRIFLLDDEGNSIVKHDHFRIDEDRQGQGFGSSFYENAEIAYMNAGIHAIYLEANLAVGGYAWARMGFDFRDGYTRDNMRDRFIADLAYKYQAHPDFDAASVAANIYHAWDIAAYEGPDGYRAGKEFLLGTNWEAEKLLSPWSMGVEIGEAYYEAKKMKKRSNE